MSEPIPFKINISEDLLSFVTHRVKTARIPSGLDLPEKEAWSYGVPPPTITALQNYWATKYDWRAVEARINSQLKMFTLPIEEAGETLNMHFVHHRSEIPGAIPLIFQHGWPGNFLEVGKIIGLLTDPEEGEQAYHVVAPSLPGFVFSEGPKGPEFGIRQMAAVDHKIMLALGYKKYVAQGGDWGSMIVRVMGLDFPESCVAVHVNMVPAEVPTWWKNPLTFAYFCAWAPLQASKGKESMLGRMMWWMKDEAGYQDIQGTKPMALSYALVDSPVGMLAWIRDKMEPLVDHTDFKWDDEEVITWAMLYIIPGSSGHANIYKNIRGEKLSLFREYLLSRVLTSEVDFGASILPYDILNVPKWWAACCVSKNIVFWKEHDSGGHFAAIEKPVELAQDIRDFTKMFKTPKLAELKESGKLKK